MIVLQYDSLPKNEFCYHLFTLLLLQTCVTSVTHQMRYFEKCQYLSVHTIEINFSFGPYSLSLYRQKQWTHSSNNNNNTGFE